MGVRLVILDLDLTLWDHWNVSVLRRPFRRVADDAIEDQEGVRVSLHPGARHVLAGLRARGVMIACASWNEPRPVDEIITLLDLGSSFDYRKVEPHPHKERTILALLHKLTEAGLPLTPDEVLYIDDRRIHEEAIRKAVGPVRFLQYGVDVRSLEDVLAHVDRAGSRPPIDGSRKA